MNAGNSLTQPHVQLIFRSMEKDNCLFGFFEHQNESKLVQMMYQMKKLPYNYIPDLGLQILELPYVDGELSLFVLLPEEAVDGSEPLLKVQYHHRDGLH